MFLEMNDHFRGIRVANHIRQRLLKNPEERRVQILVQDRFFQVRRDYAMDAGPLLKFVRLPFQSRDQTQVIQDAGPQLR